VRVRCGSAVVRARGGGEAGRPRRGRAARSSRRSSPCPSRSWPARPPARRRRHGGGHLSQLQTKQLWYFASTSTSIRSARRFDLVTLKGRAAGSCQCGPPVWRSRSNLQCRATERSGHWAGMMGCDKHGSSRREREPFGWLSKNAPGLRHLPQVYLGSRELEEPRGRSALQKRGAITVGRPRCAGR